MKNKPLTLGDYESNIIKRDEEISNSKLEGKKLKRPSYYNKQTKGLRLAKIQEANKKKCTICNETKLLEHFYSYKHQDGKLRKVNPACKQCELIKSKTKRDRIIYEKKLAVMRHYSKHELVEALCCSVCNNANIQELILIDTQYTTQKALLSTGKYMWLYEHNMPDIKLKLVCYNCAFNYIHKNLPVVKC